MSRFRQIGLVVFVAFVGLLLASPSHAGLTYNEAPDLAERVAAGELPSVEDRIPLPDDIYVVEPIDEIGSYGGMLQIANLFPNGGGEDVYAMDWPNFVTSTPQGDAVVPHLAKALEANEDATIWTLYMREGVRWSDGHPLTADDVMFWYEDFLHNEDLTPSIGAKWRAAGEVMELERIDDYTIEVRFAAPKPFFPNDLIHMNNEMVMPKHYLVQFHPNYRDLEEIENEASANGFDAWYEFFGNRNRSASGHAIVPGRPTLGPYILVDQDQSRRLWERNPYFWKVDTEGNQLPYLDGIYSTTISNREILDGMIVSGQVDFAGQQNNIESYTMYRLFEEEGNYQTFLRDTGKGNEVTYMLNLTHEDPELRRIFQNVQFRRALSLAIDREEMNDIIYNGTARPRQTTVVDYSNFFKPEFATAYVEYDPERAAQMLDEMGLDQKDSDGFRLRSDGSRVQFTIEYNDIETPKVPNIELVTQYWQEIGIDVRSRQVSGELQSQRAPANLMDATVWHADAMTDVRWPTDPHFHVPMAPGWANSIWPLWGSWLTSDGQSGEEPPEEVKQLRAWWEELTLEPDAAKREELAIKILQSQAENLWSIGTIGNALHPIIVRNGLRNVDPSEGLWVWDVVQTRSQSPSQWYFAE